ncbi:MAG TPA: NAD(P)H-hydrate dehydratase [Cyclobacteriaceae bacterium]
MKILSAGQIKAADQFTIENEPIRSIDLMERASQQLANWLMQKFDTGKKIIIFCGTGNNGGDGLALARLLSEKKYQIAAYTITKGKKGSADFEQNKARFEKSGTIFDISETSEIPFLSNKEDLIIDAIFGTGLTRKPEGLYADVIEKINGSEATIVSVDISSGLPCDDMVQNPVAVKPTYTVSFQFPKRSFFFKENAPFVGEWFIVDIGLNKEFIASQKTQFNWLTEDIVKLFQIKRKRHSHKGDFGRCLMVAGEKGKMGAAVLASKACLRAGAGLLTVVVPKCGTQILQTSVPEAMVNENNGAEFLQEQPIRIEDYDAIGIGPGIGQRKETKELLIQILKGSSKPIVADADALNLMAANQELLEILPRGSILTPHPKEFERLAGKSKNSQEQVKLQQSFSRKYKVITVLKGGYTSISDSEGNIYFNTGGNPGMATGGTGDVLTGILTGLMAQGYSPLNSALFGVFLHAKAGDLAANHGSQESLIAGDIIENLPLAFRLLSK